MGTNHKNQLGFLFMTYDGADFLWEDHFRLLNKYWPNFLENFDAFATMAETKTLKIKDELSIEPLYCAKSKTFCERIYLALKKLNTEFVFVTIDDYFLKGAVDDYRFKEVFNFLKTHKDIDYVEFENFRSKVTSAEFDLPYLKQLKKRMFLVNLQIGIWRVSSLLKILKQYENAWQFEYYGSIRAIFNKFTALTLENKTKPIFEYDFGWLVQRGKFDEDTFNYFVTNESVDYELGKKIGFRARTQDNKTTRTVKKIKHLFFALLSFFRK